MPEPVKTLIALLVCAAALALATPTESAAQTVMEKRLITKINETRAAHGLRTPHRAEAPERRARLVASSDAGRLVPSRLATRRRHGRDPRLGDMRVVHAAAGGADVAQQPLSPLLLLRPSFRYVGTGWTRGNWRGYNCVEMAVARFR